VQGREDRRRGGKEADGNGRAKEGTGVKGTTVCIFKFSLE